ncbi:MAG TPA: PEP-utilizing enzyme [Thermodesulfobacteriota bacterium]
MTEPRWFKGVWDGALNPCYTIAGYNRIEGEVHGAVRRIAVWVFEDERFILAYDQRDMYHVGAAFVGRFLRDPAHLARTWRAVRRLEGEIARLGGLAAAEVGREPPEPAARARLAAVHDRLHAAFAELFGWASLCEPCGLVLQRDLAERCAAHFGRETGPVYQARLTAPTFVSWARREAFARRRLAAALHALPRGARRLDRLPAGLARALARHATRFGFLGHNYLEARPAGAASILRAILADERGGTPPSPGPSPAAQARQAARDRARLLAAHRVPADTARRIALLDDLSRLQDERKRLVLIAMGHLDALLRHTARLAGEPLARMRVWLPDEASAFLRSGLRPSADRVAARLGAAAVVTRSGVCRLVEDPAAVARWRDRVTHVPASLDGRLAGTVASRGVAAGPARVLLTARDAGRVRRGDVLVAGNTTPDYMPALRRAAAVVTEKGGMTSHAALIARELGIPCLVGVAQVTRRVPDGARLRVDADRGVAVVEHP